MTICSQSNWPWRGFAWLGLALVLASCAGIPEDASSLSPLDQARAALKVSPGLRPDKTPEIWVHYMPWYQSPPISSTWGWHWHMGHFEPSRAAPGSPQLATHYPPLTGPYDSSDPDILEYQTLLMKIAGINGVIADWYGNADVLDYQLVHRATQQLFTATAKAGLGFGVCYEDQSIGKAVEAGATSRSESLAFAKNQFASSLAIWMRSPHYLRIAGKPALLNFGPQYFLASEQWNDLFSTLTEDPVFISLDGHMGFYADGSYPWPPMWASSNGVLSPQRLAEYLNEAYHQQEDKPWLVAGAWPRFHDIYSQAEVGPSYGYLEDAEGSIFKLTLEAALRARPDIIQIATWNDYGEGTVIEPNTIYGYRDLETIQELRRSLDPSFTWARSDLELALQIWASRKNQGNNQKRREELDKLATAIIQGQVSEARILSAGMSFDPAPIWGAQELGKPTGVASGLSSDPFAARINLAKGKTTRGSGHVAAFSAEKANDGLSTSYWEGLGKVWPSTLTLDLGAELAIEVLRLRLNPRSIWEKRTQNIAVATSSNGQDFQEMLGPTDLVFDPEANGNAVIVPVKTTTRFIRLTFHSNSAASAGQLAELEVYGTP